MPANGTAGGASGAGAAMAVEQSREVGAVRTELEIVKAGMLLEVQDRGRPGWRSQGVPAGGAMDGWSLQVANLLAGNRRDAAALEMTMSGPSLRAGKDGLLCALAGAGMEAVVDGVPLPPWRTVYVMPGRLLEIGRASRGCRAYLAVAGGIAEPPVLGSRSADARAGIGRRLGAGDALACGAMPPQAAAWAAALARRAAAAGSAGGAPLAAAPWFARPLPGAAAASGTVLRAVPGSAYGQLTEAARARLWRERFRAAPASDRMGVRLQPEAHPVELIRHAEIRSHGVTPGAVQLPPGGAPVVLGAGCGTTGGYPVILHVASADLPLLAQLRPGDSVSFSEIGLEEAQLLDLGQELELAVLDHALRLKTLSR